jgi:SAM-dependent methyltransferase
MLEPRADPRDVTKVQRVTAAHWREGYSSRYVESYWDGVDAGRDSAGTRRSAWLADLPAFRDAASALELGCGPGRNLWALQQRHPAMTLQGIDINPEGIAHARTRVRGEFLSGDLYQLPALLGDRRVDVIFTMGVLIHLHPDTLPVLLEAMRAHARRSLVFVEQVSATNEVVKGPARWAPSRKVTGDYIQWSPDLPGMLRRLGVGFEHTPLPESLQSNGARDLLVVNL